ncbi:hypothetical protein AB1Y20_006109 [Prymnesium parvum]|uniref:Uncharacterized protein n=1 Tax=Prymnesium parvum TaxID=97485 RepID=A0AB34J475_PRYPA
MLLASALYPSALLLPLSTAFVSPTALSHPNVRFTSHTAASSPRATLQMRAPSPFDPLDLDKLPPRVAARGDEGGTAVQLAACLALVSALYPDAALAKDGEFGIFEGRIVSLAHPVVMALMYSASAYAAFSGLQWRRLREIGTEISELKEQQKPLKAKIEAAGDEQPVDAALSRQVSALQAQIDELSSTRKELAEGSFRDKHFQVGSVILGLGTAFAIEGPVNTFIRAQKLFPGPHLYAGAGIVVCWAMAASLVPLMSKGKDSARSAHIAFNALALGLFTWQLPTGWDITQKVIKFTSFP